MCKQQITYCIRPEPNMVSGAINNIERCGSSHRERTPPPISFCVQLDSGSNPARNWDRFSIYVFRSHIFKIGNRRAHFTCINSEHVYTNSFPEPLAQILQNDFATESQGNPAKTQIYLKTDLISATLHREAWLEQSPRSPKWRELATELIQ